MKSLVIAEKPSVARDIAKVLGCKTKGDGYLEGNNYIVTWAIGHLVTLCEPEDYDMTYKAWSMKTLPILPEEMKLKPIRTTYKQYTILKSLLGDKTVDTVICATDAGREGELIFRYIYQLCHCKKPIKRLWISSLTDEAIQEGFRNLKDGKEYDRLYHSARSRSESDWLVGMNATRAYTIKYKDLLTIGRVQTPTLALLVNRENEIQHFIPKDYWELKCYFDGYQGIWFDRETKETKIDLEERAESLKAKVEGKEGIVTDIETKKVVKKPPLLYDLTELQRDANKRYGYTAEQTLNIAQSLYEKRKAITYPRTDSRYLSKDIIKSLRGKIQNLKDTKYGEYTTDLLKLEKLPITKRIVDDSKVSDHHAIIPTDKKTDIGKLTPEEKNIFYLVVIRFLAVFYPDYIYNSTTVITEVEGEPFKTTGQMVVQMGWRTLEQDDEEKEPNIPQVKKKQQVSVNEVKLDKKQTQPPKRYNESMLLSAMENAGKFVEDEELKEQLKEGGIGTPATRASIIERLIKVGYVTREGKNLVPTDKGIKLIALVPKELSSPEMTGKWERALNKIAQGKMDRERFMEGIRNFTIFLVRDAYERQTNLQFEKQKRKGSPKSETTENRTVETLGPCPACQQGNVLEGNKSYYCSRYKEGCKFGLFKDDKLMAKYKKKMTKTTVKQLITKGETVMKGMISPKTQKKFDGKIKIKALDTGYWGWYFDFNNTLDVQEKNKKENSK
ncbi:DNA topoisomerase III [Anaerosolibacter sp.]|uniref:DNA topoisomerase III n=1 Tax=Anaerosolibacter sp. TaxID=1872527 RepID=UPI0039F0572B